METISNLGKSKIKTLKKEYLLKREKIAQRLNDFDRFYNEPYSWFFDNNFMILKKVNKNDDERIFEELCFCILTANTSAEMGMKAIDAIRDILLDGTMVEMSR